jgi:hypothetical protein
MNKPCSKSGCVWPFAHGERLPHFIYRAKMMDDIATGKKWKSGGIITQSQAERDELLRDSAYHAAAAHRPKRVIKVAAS